MCVCVCVNIVYYSLLFFDFLYKYTFKTYKQLYKEVYVIIMCNMKLKLKLISMATVKQVIALLPHFKSHVHYVLRFLLYVVVDLQLHDESEKGCVGTCFFLDLEQPGTVFI